jgi:hypothetical protein
MTTGLQARESRLVGAAVALALDIALLAAAAVLVRASFSPAFAFVVAAGVGLVVAPLVGWRYGRAAMSRQGDSWARDAVRDLLLIAAAIIAGLVVLQGALVPVEGGIAGRVALLGYAVVTDTLAVGFLSIVSAILIGIPWVGLMRSLGR